MKLLIKGKKFEIYMSVVGTWTDPILIMKEGKRQEKMTTSSGELELSLGEFMINDSLIEDLKRVDLMLDEIADQDSIEYIRENIRIFRLKDEYVEKAKEIYHSK
ncbi:MAG TPA: hypothetical protein GXZ90_05250 [Clostridiales bacterium]|nr:hypothetical protein [Clostridiales bacterium]